MSVICDCFLLCFSDQKQEVENCLYVEGKVDILYSRCAMQPSPKVVAEGARGFPRESPHFKIKYFMRKIIFRWAVSPQKKLWLLILVNPM